MKTLVISGNYPLPENGGDKIRTMNFVRYLKKLGDTDLLYYQQDDQKNDFETPFGNAFHVDTHEGDYANGLLRLYEKIKYSKPWAVGSFSNQSLKQVVNIIEQQDYDYILCRYAKYAFPLFQLSEKYRKRVIVDIDDIMTGALHEENHNNLSGLDKIKAKIDFKLYQKYQLKCAALGKALICSENDRKAISKHKESGNVFIVPNIAPSFKVPDSYRKNGHGNINTVLFVGNLAYGPNIQGIKWFIEEILERLATDGVHIKLIIAGKEPGAPLKSICSKYEQIELIDSPLDMVPLYDRCGVVIVPLLTGGGTRIKILEAGRALRPVITTETGAYGLNLKDYDDALFMNDTSSFVERFNWLKNKDNYDSVVKNMSDYVSESYDVGSFERAMDRALNM